MDLRSSQETALRTMVFTRLSALAVCIAVGLACVDGAQILRANEKVKIDVASSADAIRTEILKHTPIGSGAEDVAEFILSRLDYEGSYTSGIGIMPRPAVSVELGHRSGNSQLSHTSIQAQWIFDEKLKLRDIQIKELPQEGGFDPKKAADNSPKVRVDLLQSDQAIQQQLLKYTPVGSQLTAILAFLKRLHYLGGPASGTALTGKSGMAVVLGHLVDSATGRDRVVQVNWVLDDNDNLKDIEVRRVDWSLTAAQ